MKKFYHQFRHVFIEHNWDWSTEEVPDQLLFYGSLLHEQSFEFTAVCHVWYQVLCQIWMTLHPVELNNNNNWPERVLWADLGTIFNDYTSRLIFESYLTFGYLISGILITLHYYAVSCQQRHHCPVPWYTCWLTWLDRPSRRLAAPVGCYTLDDRVFHWKVAYLTQLASLVAGFVAATCWSLFAGYALLHFFPFDKPLKEIYHALSLFFVSLTFYTAFVITVLHCTTFIIGAALCQVFDYFLRSTRIDRKINNLKTIYGEQNYTQHAASFIQDKETLENEIVLLAPLLRPLTIFSLVFVIYVTTALIWLAFDALCSPAMTYLFLIWWIHKFMNRL